MRAAGILGMMPLQMRARLRAAVLGLVALPLSAQDPAPTQASGSKGARMDYGPFLSSTVSRAFSEKDADIHAYKGISIRVGKDRSATVCFDTDLLRMAAGWTGGFLDLSKTHQTREKGSLPTTRQGELRFATGKGPGWARDGSFRDPRPIARGPLPRDWAHYKGLYLNGSDVILSYTVGDCAILEMPGFAPADGTQAFTRTFQVGPSPAALAMRLCGKDVPVALVEPPSGSALEVVDDEWILKLPPRPGPSRFAVALGGRPGKLPVADLTILTRGGPPRWEPVATRGMLGLGNAPWLVDTLTLPDNNPWSAWMRLTGIDFFSDGRAAVCTWNGDVWTVSGIDASLEKLTWRRFATGLYEPLGLRIVEDTVYALGRDQITRLHDLNGDGEADFYENFNNDSVTVANYHAFAFELHTDREGNFYHLRDGHRVDSWIPGHGAMIRVSKDGSRSEVFCTGFRAPNGMSIGPDDEITSSDNQGNWIPTSRLNWVKRDGFYGFVTHAPSPERAKSYDPPLCWIPHGVDNSSGGQVWVTSDRWGPFQGRLLHTSYGTSSLFQVLVDRTAEPAQGAVVRFPLVFSCGIMRGRFSPKDGQLYLAGLRGWQTKGVRDGALHRVRYTGAPVRSVIDWRATKSGIDLTFTVPLDPESATEADNYAVHRWNYVWSEKYGSPEYSVADPKRQGRDEMEVKAVRLSPDGRTVSLEIPGMRPVMQMLIRLRLKAADGGTIPLEIYATLNRI